MATFVRTQEIAHEIGERGRFALRVTNPDVEMRGDDGTTARVRITFEIRAPSDAKADEIFDALRYHVTQRAGSLEVAEPKHGAGSVLGALVHLSGIRSDRVETNVEVDAPSLSDLRYDGVSADLTATDFRGNQEYRTVSGDLVLDRVGGDVGIKGVSSDISLRADDPLSSLEINTVSGDISGVAPRIGRLRATTVSGDVELEGILADGPEHRIETVSGDVSLGVTDNLTLEVRGLSSDADIRLPHRSEGSRDRRRYVIGTGGPQVLFSSMSGDIEVRPPRRTGGAPPAPPAPVTAPTPPTPPRPPSIGEDDQLAVLRALERGEIDVDEAARRLGGGRGSDV